MKKLFLLAAAATFAFAANAKVWRINYDENANADFKTLTAACASGKVANTDTLYCEAGHHYGSADDNVISRKGMKVFGPGWGFEANYGNTSTIAEARFTAEIRIAASNVTLSGVVTNSNISAQGSVLRNITIDRCNASCVWFSNKDTLNVITIKNCYLKRIYFADITRELKNVTIENNIIVQRNDGYNNQAIYILADGMYTYSLRPEYISNVRILRNTIVFAPNNNWNDCIPVIVWSSLIQDNIIINPNDPSNIINFASDRGNIIRKNVLSLDGTAIGNADIVSNFPDNYFIEATEAGTFTCTQSTYRSEQYFQLKDGSPAKNAAYDGGDCGAFGGSTPYIICGRPQGIPYITDVEVPAQPTNNQLTVTFKVANQNE